MAKYVNTSGIPLSLAVFLATDNYDYNDDPNTVSVTTLLKPLRQVILAARVPPGEGLPDLGQLMQSRMGNAIHDAIERAWKDNYRTAMTDIGLPSRVIDRIKINPDAEMIKIWAATGVDVIPVYLEQRASKKVGKWTVTGKYDFVGEGQVEDFKSTSTFTMQSGNSDDKYPLQGSMYRWLNPDIITSDHMAINWIFTDWSKLRAMQDPTYPQQRWMRKLFPLMTVAATQAFVERKLALIEQYWDADEADIPECSDEELWRSAPVHKYYKSGVVSARSTKNFDTLAEAMQRHQEDGGKGLVKTVPGQVKACSYCPAFAACSQKDRLVASGDLVL